MTTRKKTTTKKKTKTAARKKAPAKKKTAAKKKTVAKKKAAAKKKAVAKKAPRKTEKAVSSKKKVPVKKKTAAKKMERDNKEEGDEERKATLKSYARTKKHTPAVFKLPSKKNTPIVFSLEDVREALKKKQENHEPESKPVDQESTAGKTQPAAKKASRSLPVIDEPQQTDHSVHKAASISDILGFNPQAKAAFQQNRHKNIPRKYMKYYKLLVELREHVLAGLDLHTQETLKRSAKDDTGDLSSYSQHMADAGTDNFDRDFALSLVSNEQEALYEVAEAIQRIHNGTYGICEITGQQISRERLEAVPFTRYSVEGQAELEKNNRKKIQRQGVFIDSTVEASVQFTDDDSD